MRRMFLLHSHTNIQPTLNRQQNIETHSVIGDCILFFFLTKISKFLSPRILVLLDTKAEFCELNYFQTVNSKQNS